MMGWPENGTVINHNEEYKVHFELALGAINYNDSGNIDGENIPET